MSTLVAFCRWQTRCGRFRWAVAVCVFLLFLLGVATSQTALIVLAALPCVVATFWLTVAWEWSVVMEPWTEGRPQLRKPLLALNALHWAGPLLLTFLEPGGDGHGPYPPNEISESSEPIWVSPLRYNWFGSMAVMAAILWLLAMGSWLLRQLLPPKVWSERPAAWKLKARLAVSVAVVLLYTVLTVVSITAGYRTPRVVDVTMPLQGLPACLSGYSVAMLSDVHAGPLVGKADVAEFVAQLNALGADTQVLVGDFADGPPALIADELAPLAGLEAPDGVFYVTGNHEDLHGATGTEWMHWVDTELPRVTPLNNTGVALPAAAAAAAAASASSRFGGCSAGETFDLLGVVDHSQGDHMAEAISSAKAKLPPATARKVATAERASLLLAHQPLSADRAAESGVGGTVSGHTHGGQVWPIHWSTFVVNKGRVAGGFQLPRTGGSSMYDMQLYVGEGAVGWGPRLRLWARTEITRITLVPMAGSADVIESASSHPGQSGGLIATILLVVSAVYVCATRVRAAARDFSSMRAGNANSVDDGGTTAVTAAAATETTDKDDGNGGGAQSQGAGQGEP
jgi:predicted MPP superfamily phosphohydrolase